MSTTTSDAATAVATAASTTLFPCLEQPIKAYLTSSSSSSSSSSSAGHQRRRRRLVSHKDGTVVAVANKPSSSTTAAAEFFLLPVAGGVVTIKSVLHGRYLSVSNNNNNNDSNSRPVVSTVEKEIPGPAEEWRLTKVMDATRTRAHGGGRQQRQNNSDSSNNGRQYTHCLLTSATTGVHLACCPDTGVLFTTLSTGRCCCPRRWNDRTRTTTTDSA